MDANQTKKTELKRLVQAWRERDGRRGGDWVSSFDWNERYPDLVTISDALHFQLIQVLTAEVVAEL